MAACSPVSYRNSFLKRRALGGLPCRTASQNAFRVAVRRVVDLGHRVEQRRLALGAITFGISAAGAKIASAPLYRGSGGRNERVYQVARTARARSATTRCAVQSLRPMRSMR
jgi:hypothetical protein